MKFINKAVERHGRWQAETFPVGREGHVTMLPNGRAILETPRGKLYLQPETGRCWERLPNGHIRTSASKNGRGEGAAAVAADAVVREFYEANGEHPAVPEEFIPEGGVPPHVAPSTLAAPRLPVETQTSSPTTTQPLESASQTGSTSLAQVRSLPSDGSAPTLRVGGFSENTLLSFIGHLTDAGELVELEPPPARSEPVPARSEPVPPPLPAGVAGPSTLSSAGSFGSEALRGPPSLRTGVASTLSGLSASSYEAGFEAGLSAAAESMRGPPSLRVGPSTLSGLSDGTLETFGNEPALYRIS